MRARIFDRTLARPSVSGWRRAARSRRRSRGRRPRPSSALRALQGEGAVLEFIEQAFARAEIVEGHCVHETRLASPFWKRRWIDTERRLTIVATEEARADLVQHA